jgi:hypothetical protein
MSRTFTKQDDSRADYILCPAGTMTATLTVMAFVGQHPQTWQGEEKIKEMIGLQYEVSELGPDGRPLSVSETMPFSTHEKSRFYSRLIALLGGAVPPDGFDFKALLGRSCIITVTHVQKGERVYANVTQAGAVPRGMAGPAPSVTPVYFDILSPAESCPWDSLPGRFKKMVETAIPTQPANPSAPPAAPPSGQWSGYQAPPPAQHSGGQAFPPAPPPGRQTPSPAAAGWQTQPPDGYGYQPPAPPAGTFPDDDIPF